jgi:hypothetical protein
MNNTSQPTATIRRYLAPAESATTFGAILDQLLDQHGHIIRAVTLDLAADLSDSWPLLVTYDDTPANLQALTEFFA